MTSKIPNLPDLLHELYAAYSAEKVISLHLAELMTLTREGITIQAIYAEASENKKHCKRLEGLIEAVRPLLSKPIVDRIKEKLVDESLTLLQRITLKHKLAGYDTSIMAAHSAGRGDIAKALERSVSASRKLV